MFKEQTNKKADGASRQVDLLAIKPVHLYVGGFNGQDFDHSSLCGLGDYSDRSFRYGAHNIKEVTCKNCLKLINKTSPEEELARRQKKRSRPC